MLTSHLRVIGEANRFNLLYSILQIRVLLNVPASFESLIVRKIEKKLHLKRKSHRGSRKGSGGDFFVMFVLLCTMSHRTACSSIPPLSDSGVLRVKCSVNQVESLLQRLLCCHTKGQYYQCQLGVILLYLFFYCLWSCSILSA